jgi:hypothetical protein
VGYDGWQSSVEFQADAAALRARHIVAVMLAKEAGRSTLRPGLSKTKQSDNSRNSASIANLYPSSIDTRSSS